MTAGAARPLYLKKYQELEMVEALATSRSKSIRLELISEFAIVEKFTTRYSEMAKQYQAQ